MSRKTKELQTLWWDWLGTAERLQQALHEQTAALTLRNAERVEQVTPRIDNLMSTMSDIDERAAALARELAEELGAVPSLRGLVGALEKAEAQQVQALANRVIVAGRNIQRVVERNKKLIENELDFVEGTFAIIAKTASEQQRQYSTSKQEQPVLLNQVA